MGSLVPGFLGTHNSAIALPVMNRTPVDLPPVEIYGPPESQHYGEQDAAVTRQRSSLRVPRHVGYQDSSRLRMKKRRKQNTRRPPWSRRISTREISGLMMFKITSRPISKQEPQPMSRYALRSHVAVCQC
jgi:hypothetical protein